MDLGTTHMQISNCLAAWALASLLFGTQALAHDAGGQPPSRAIPAALRVDASLAPLSGVADLKFREFFRMPIGPRGLEPSARLLDLAGQQVRLVGYMARQEADASLKGRLVLTPLPISMGDEDESFADDLPATAVYVHLSASHAGQVVPFMPGLMALSGRVELGSMAEPDGRRSMVRLVLDDDVSQLLATPEQTASLNSPAMPMEKSHGATR
jgi:hypothetical protein